MSFFGDLAAALRGGSGPQTTAPDRLRLRPAPDVQAWLAAAYADDAQDREREALEALRERGQRSVDDLAEGYWRAGEADVALRWSLVHCAVLLALPETTGFLADVVAAPIPPERSHDVHEFSSVNEEVTQRFRALQGLHDRAASRDGLAVDALLEALDHPVVAVRAVAYQHLRELPDGIVDPERLRRLSADDREQFDRLRRVDVERLEDLRPDTNPDLPSPDRYQPPESSHWHRPPVVVVEGDNHG